MAKISIGIAAYNEEKTIQKSIESALESLPSPSEVIVVASGCTDGTVQIAQGIATRNHKVRLFVEKERKGKGSAINIILRNAVGDFIIMTDADLSFPPHSPKALLSKMGKKTGAVSGRPEYHASAPMFKWWARFASECANRQRIVRERKGFHGISGYLYAIRRGIVRGIPASAKSEDAYVGEIVKEKGYGISYAPDATVSVGYAENYRDYLTQKIRTHFGHLEVFDKDGSGSAMESVKKASGMRSEIRQYFGVANEMIRTPAEGAYFVFYLFTEVLVWAAAFLKFYFKGEEEWKQIKSTKK